MELERRRRRRRNDRKEAMEDRSIHDLPDDLLRRIFLRLDSPQWLVRAACACKRWRGALTDEGRAFLRLASSLHLPIVVGQYHNDCTHGRFHYRFVPSSSSPIIDGSCFSFDKLHDEWSSVADCRGGLVLFSMSYGPRPVSDPNLVVYDPMTRKRRWIPPCLLPPNKNEKKQVFGYDVFLLDGDDDGHISLSNFRLLYRLYQPATAGGPKTYVFSSANGGEWGDWRFSIICMELLAHRQNRNVFNYTLPWRLLRPCP